MGINAKARRVGRDAEDLFVSSVHWMVFAKSISLFALLRASAPLRLSDAYLLHGFGLQND